MMIMMMISSNSRSSPALGLGALLVSVQALLMQQYISPIDAFSPSTTPLPSTKISSTTTTTTTALHLRVAYQGEPGAYSEKSTRELLGDNVIAVGKPNFEACFRAVASMEVDYCCLPVENSLGGSIHENYDLMLRYDLTICAEHEFRVQHCVLAKEGVRLPNGKETRTTDDNNNKVAKYAISHPQALAQCDNYLRSLGITPIPTYDTAGSAKMIQDDDLPDRCTPDNTIAIASDLAGTTYGMNCLAKGVEDDDSNFTRFLLLGRKGVLEYLGKDIPSKTSVVFTLPNTAGALYKALACFSLREIDFSKIESRPTSAALLNYLKFRKSQKTFAEESNKSKNSANGNNSSSSSSNNNNNNNSSINRKTSNGSDHAHNPKDNANSGEDLPRFRYCFYLDFLEGQLSSNSVNALNNLREFTDFVRILGSYPQKSRLVGPVSIAAEEIKIQRLQDDTERSTMDRSSSSRALHLSKKKSLSIGLVGFGSFGQVLASQMIQDHHSVSCLDVKDKSVEAEKIGVSFHFDASAFLQGLDVVVLSVPLIRLQATIDSLPINDLRGKLVVDVGPLNGHPKSILLDAFANYPDIDVLVTNPLLGHLPREEDQANHQRQDSKPLEDGVVVMAPSSHEGHSSNIWEGRQLVYERARVANIPRCDRYLEIFENARCEVLEQMANDDDTAIGDAQFITHLIGRILHKDLLTPTPIMSEEYKNLKQVSEMASKGSFDRFYGMYRYNEHSEDQIRKLRENLAAIECELAARGAYLSAKEEMAKADRQKLLSETRRLLQELAKTDGLTETPSLAATTTDSVDESSSSASSSSSSCKDTDANDEEESVIIL